MNHKERFESKVMPEPNTGCWIWTGCLFDNGYGVFRIGGKNKKAHRFSYELSKGVIPDGLVVCHRCDNKMCVNPDHLFLGTMQDNVTDMVTKGRKHYPKGELHGQAKLCASDVLHIRENARRGNHKIIAAQLGISPSYIGSILRRDKWAHI
jgi:hypothetical protein